MASEAGPYLRVPALLSLRIPKPPENEAVWYLHSTGTICGCKHPNYEARLERQGWESAQGLNCPGALAEPGGSTWCCFSLPNPSNPACCLQGDADLLSFSQKKKSGITPQDLTLQVLLPPRSTTAATFKKLSFKNLKSAPKQDITIFHCQTRQAQTQTMHFSS